MILDIHGEINTYYVQTLCMIFFPGAKFSKDQEEGNGPIPKLTLTLDESQSGLLIAHATLQYDRKVSESTETHILVQSQTLDRQRKIVTGKAIFMAGKQMFRYTSPWGILTGVRPAKVANDILLSGNTPTKTKRILRDEYLLNPQKASLAVTVAQTEMSLMRPNQSHRCSIYISIPFCPSRCSYCSFVSYTTPRLLSLIDEYLEVLLTDISHIFSMIKRIGLELATIYIGGGTPTILSASQLEKLLSHIALHTDVTKLEEYTLEGGRPDTITEEKIRICLAHGINRISVNPQTLRDDLLRSIGRMHTVDEFMRAYELVQSSGMPHINVDLIAGLPGDSFANFSSSLDRIIELAPDNITVHTFCVKKAADLLQKGKNVYSRSGGDAAKSVSYSQLKTKFAGYRPYYLYRQKNTVGNLENVGYAKEGAEGMYNIYMMEEMHTIFAAGAGAVTKLVYREVYQSPTDILRIFTPKYPYEYLSRAKQAMCADAPSLPHIELEKTVFDFYEQKHYIKIR